MVDLFMLDLGLGLALGLGLRFYFLSIQKYSYNAHKRINNKDKEQSIIAVNPTPRLASLGLRLYRHVRSSSSPTFLPISSAGPQQRH